MHIMLNDGKLFKEVMKILEKDKSECKLATNNLVYMYGTNF